MQICPFQNFSVTVGISLSCFPSPTIDKNHIPRVARQFSNLNRFYLCNLLIFQFCRKGLCEKYCSKGGKCSIRPLAK